jgi:cellulose synthase/poly-beta-1,6-N-acetylglucosamine synthase-like glycosyltransferase
MAASRAHAAAWWVAFILQAAAVVAWPLPGVSRAAVGVVGLAFFVLRAAWTGRITARDSNDRRRRWLQAVLLAEGCVCIMAGPVLVEAAGSLPAQAAALALWVTGAQALLWGLTFQTSRTRWRRPRNSTALSGHGLLLGGSLALLFLPSKAVLVACWVYPVGLGLLLLTALWTREDLNGGRDGWHSLFLLGLILVLTVLALCPLLRNLPEPRLLAAASQFAVFLTGFGIGLMAGPPGPPVSWHRDGRDARPFAIQAAAGFVLTNLVVVALLLMGAALAVLIVAWLVLWTLASVAFEYASVLHHWRRHRRRKGSFPGQPQVDLRQLTVVMVAKDEAAILPASMERLLALDSALSVILVPSQVSQDSTVQVCRDLARRVPQRIRVATAFGASKGDDLQAAWRLVRTPYVLILDADESIDAQSLAHGLQTLAGRPDVGVVQGRKASPEAEATPFTRFVNVERRFSTLLAHPLWATRDAVHFAGSGALLRRQVPEEAGGWSSPTLTEDIDLTYRIHLRTRWRVVYEPGMVVREADPVNLRELVRQRSRWARGWIECAGLHARAVVGNRQRLGRRRALALFGQLSNAVSAPWAVAFPALILFWFAGGPRFLPIVAGLLLLGLTFPSRLLAYDYAVVHAPRARGRHRLRRALEASLYAYLWVILGWLLQLHAIYLELSQAPRTWTRTGKRAAGARHPTGDARVDL